jgi:hypothetical protein
VASLNCGNCVATTEMSYTLPDAYAGKIQFPGLVLNLQIYSKCFSKQRYTTVFQHRLLIVLDQKAPSCFVFNSYRSTYYCSHNSLVWSQKVESPKTYIETFGDYCLQLTQLQWCSYLISVWFKQSLIEPASHWGRLVEHIMHVVNRLRIGMHDLSAFAGRIPKEGYLAQVHCQLNYDLIHRSKP